MEKKPGPAELLSALLRDNSYSVQELDHLYRLLSKRSHPDATGGDSGEEFIALRRVYEESRLHLEKSSPGMGLSNGNPSAYREPAGPSEARGGSSDVGGFGVAHRAAPTGTGMPPQSFDPYKPIREAGYEESISNRACLFVVLRSFFNMGLHNYKIRSMKGLKRRNAEILRAILYWARLYDPEFASLFAAYSRHSFQSLSTTWEIKNFNYAKRLFLDGVTGFFDFQKSGRKGTAVVAADKLTWCSYTLRKVIRQEHPMAPLAEWFISELEQAPALRPEY